MADFIEKITGGIDRGIKTLSSKSKEFIEVNRLKSELKEVDAILEAKFHSVGRKVFQMMNREAFSEDSIKTECSEIADCYKKISEIEENIRKAEKEALKVQYGFDAVMCPACGGVNKEGDLFCNICGSSITAENKKDCRTCPSCSAMVARDAKFCASCGKAMPKEDSPSAMASVKTCHKCNQQLSAEEIFCHACGTKQ